MVVVGRPRSQAAAHCATNAVALMAQ